MEVFGTGLVRKSRGVHLLILKAVSFFSCRITAKVPMAKGKEASASNDKEVLEDADNEKKTS